MCWKNSMIWKKKSKIPITIKIQTIYKTMLSYCLKCRKNTESKNPKVLRTKIGGIIMLLSKCVVCDGKKIGKIY